MYKNHILKHSEKSEFLDSTLCLASYMKHIVIGRVEMTADSQTIFEDSKTVLIKNNMYYPFARVLRKADHYFQCKRDSKFEVDILPPTTKNPLYKLVATFGTYGESTEPIFQVRSHD